MAVEVKAHNYRNKFRNRKKLAKLKKKKSKISMGIKIGNLKILILEGWLIYYTEYIFLYKLFL